MRAKQEDLVREHEKQLAAKLKSDETERFVQMQFMYFHHLLSIIYQLIDWSLMI